MPLPVSSGRQQTARALPLHFHPIAIQSPSHLHPISIEFPSNSIELTAIMSIISYLWRWWTDDRLRQSAKTSPEIRSIRKSIRRDSSLMGRTVSLAVSRSPWHRLAVDGARAVLTAGRRAIQPCGRSFAYCFHSPSVTVATRGPFSEFNFNFQEMTNAKLLPIEREI